MKARSIVAVVSVLASAVACGAPAGTESPGSSQEAMQSSGGLWGMPGGPAWTRENCSGQPWGTDAFSVAMKGLGCGGSEVAWGDIASGGRAQYWYVSVCPDWTSTSFYCPASGESMSGNYQTLVSCWTVDNGATVENYTCANTAIGPGYIGIEYDPNCSEDCIAPKI